MVQKFILLKKIYFTRGPGERERGRERELRHSGICRAAHGHVRLGSKVQLRRCCKFVVCWHVALRARVQAHFDPGCLGFLGDG